MRKTVRVFKKFNKEDPGRTMIGVTEVPTLLCVQREPRNKRGRRRGRTVTGDSGMGRTLNHHGGDSYDAI